MTSGATIGGAARREHRSLTALARRRVCAALAAIVEGELTIVDGGDSLRFEGERSGPRAEVVVHDARIWRALALGGALGGAEAYIDGWWSADDLAALVRVLARNASALGGLERGGRWRAPVLRIWHRLRDNDRAGSRRNISAHYDLGNALFETFLDSTLTYSSAVFERPAATLEEAQRTKYERLCRKLALRPEHHVLEIGGGWGGFAIHAAREHGCRVTTTTISRAQHALARERVAAAGLSDRVEVLCRDYRDLDGSYDRVASIEMIEAVGHRHLPRFFEVCAQRLAPDGMLALQAILVPERDWERSKRSVEFVKRYVFPGSQLVALGAISRAIEATDLTLTHYEDITPHYAETLRRWRERFLASRARVGELGYDARFQRTWEFYLAYCEGAFRERVNLAAQLVFEKAGTRANSLLGALERPAAED
jgi:cyclopropane-fatty-acyl-phospholipid synthase